MRLFVCHPAGARELRVQVRGEAFDVAVDDEARDWLITLLTGSCAMTRPADTASPRALPGAAEARATRARLGTDRSRAAPVPFGLPMDVFAAIRIISAVPCRADTPIAPALVASLSDRAGAAD